MLVVSSPSAVKECFGKNDIIFANRPPTMAGDISTFLHMGSSWTSLEMASGKAATRNKETEKMLLSYQEENPEFLSDEVIKGTAVMMFIAGSEMPKVTIEWAMSLLLNHPEVLKKVRAEIDNHVGHERLLNESDLTKLPYLRCIVNETLRLYPAGPFLVPNYSSEDCMVGVYELQCFEWENVGSDTVDMTPRTGSLLSKAMPLEALCSPRPELIKLLTQF
ncbi:Cytochrome P450 [Hibiscus syriacus]|uniref:Cytochrome P450 n=1 Tax=Hibiscus syriacus TaxID=106335 RepID=A0A6A2ZJX7_HIBSY|nr:Cytochrome P450 [Hibiscus syriacus]